MHAGAMEAWLRTLRDASGGGAQSLSFELDDAGRLLLIAAVQTPALTFFRRRIVAEARAAREGSLDAEVIHLLGGLRRGISEHRS